LLSSYFIYNSIGAIDEQAAPTATARWLFGSCGQCKALTGNPGWIIDIITMINYLLEGRKTVNEWTCNFTKWVEMNERRHT
jgi:hypothetical protein